MAYIEVPEDQPGILGLLAFRPKMAKLLNELVEALLRTDEGLSAWERELIATYVSSQNGCYFCETVHGSVVTALLGGNESLVDEVKSDYTEADISEKLRALLAIAGSVQESGLAVTPEQIEAAHILGATDLEIHDTVLIAAAFCMFNRYVNGLRTVQPRDAELYRQVGIRVAREGYIQARHCHSPE